MHPIEIWTWLGAIAFNAVIAAVLYDALRKLPEIAAISSLPIPYVLPLNSFRATTE